MKLKNILLIGTGPMACEYVKVLKTLGYDILVIGRGEKSALEFEKTTGIKPFTGGPEKFFSLSQSFPKKAIIAVSEEQLGLVTLLLLKHNINLILVEKPGGANIAEIRKVEKEAKKNKARVYIGYNRRFYSSVKKIKQIIKQDGKVKSFHFEFTELSSKISPLKKGPGVKENWFLHNSSHVIDLAFFLGGYPKKISAYKNGCLSWHPGGSIFAGAGQTESGALFSYFANWESPGRWAVEILTQKHRLILKPLEKLQIQYIGSFDISETKIDNNFDLKYKPGLYNQVKSFLGNKKDLCTITEQFNNLKYYEKILIQNSIN